MCNERNFSLSKVGSRDLLENNWHYSDLYSDYVFYSIRIIDKILSITQLNEFV
jgi:hypothetical protein